jgi:hypothetical protein
MGPMKSALFLLPIIVALHRSYADTRHRRYKIDLLRNESNEEETRVIRVATSASLYYKSIYAMYGRDMVRSWDMFAEWLNKERGGIKYNGSNYSIVFNFIEDYSDNSLVTKVYKSLLEDFDLYFCPYSSSLAWNAVDVTDPAGRFLLATSASGTAVFKNRRSSFTTLPSNVAFLDSGFAAFTAYGSKTTAVIKDMGYGGCGTAQNSNDAAIKAGITLYKHYDVDPASPSYASIVSDIIAELKAQEVETVMGCTYLGLCYEVYR